MRKYTAEKYLKLVEGMDDPIFQDYMQAELGVILKIENADSKSFIDLGAGYGRLLPHLAKIARNVISIEINPEMLGELRKRTERHKNAVAIEGDIQRLSKILEGCDMQKPVLILTQNTLGTIEGDYKKVLSEMRTVAKKHRGEIIIVFQRQESLREWGIEMYSKIKEMVGEPDLEKTDFEKGIFVSKTGYTSKWWSSTEIKKIKEYFGGKIINEKLTRYFAVIHISLSD